MSFFNVSRGLFGSRTRSAVLAAVVLLSVSLFGASAQAAIALTPAGTALGFTLSTFASGFPPTQNVGPLGIAFTSTGGVLVTDKVGDIRLFLTDTDGQVAPAATQHYGIVNASSSILSNATGLAQVGNNIYMTRQGVGDVVQINQNGSLNQVIVGGIDYATGIVANPANGHLFVSSIGMNQIYDVNPITKTKTPFISGNVDGLSVSADGGTLYVVRQSDGHVIGYNTTSKAVVFDSGAIPGGIDGTALGQGSLLGNIFANTNGGTLVQVNLATGVQTVIASGGSRGDFVTIDTSGGPNNGTLLLTQSDSVVRLIAPDGGGFVAAPLPPGVWAGAVTALGGVVLGRRAAKKRGSSLK